MIRRTQITIERRSVTIIRLTGTENPVRCRRCGRDVPAFTPARVAEMTGADGVEILRRLDAGEIHLVNTGESVGLVCANSLSEGGSRE